MSDFINTIDILGDDAVIDSIIDRSITEFKDNVITKVGDTTFRGCASLEVLDLPNVTSLGAEAFEDCASLKMLYFPNVVGTIASMNQAIGNCGGGDGYGNNPSNTYLKLPCVTRIDYYGFRRFSPRVAEFSSAVNFANSAFGYGCCGYLILRNETMSVAQGTPFTGGIRNYIYVPRSLIDSYKTATNWSNYADQFRAIEDVTVDGTASGELISCTGITLDKTVLTFDKGGGQRLTATIATPSPIGADIIYWKSTDASVAKVVEGVVIPIGKGTATITATCNGYSASCEVEVTTDGLNLYSLPEPMTFNGTSDYIDTGIQLFDEAKSFTIICEAEFSKLTDQNKCLLHCINEVSPWPGLSIDGSNGIRICYTGSSSLTTTISNRNAVSALAIRYVDGKMNAIRYKNTSGDIVTQTINGTPTYTKVTQNLLLGAYQDTSGTKGRFFNGTINRFEVYPTALSDEEIAAIL